MRIQSVMVLHLDVIKYDEALVIVDFQNPTHRDYVMSLERANLQAVFSGAFNDAVSSTVTSFRFAESSPSPTLRLSACANASAGLVFQGRLGLGSPNGSELTGKVSVTTDVRADGDGLSLSETVNLDFTWNSEKKAFEATNEQDGGNRDGCALPWLDVASMMTRDWL